MSKIRFSKKKFIVLAAVVAIAVGVFYFWRDLHLSAVKRVPLPDVVVEDIEVERLVDGKMWKLISPRVEHKNGLIHGVSLDVTITEDNGKVTYIYADKGTFSRKNNNLDLTHADGTMKQNDKEYNLKSGRAKYTAAKDLWNFSKGVTLTDGHFVVSGKTGYYDAKKGECGLTNGGTISWNDR